MLHPLGRDKTFKMATHPVEATERAIAPVLSELDTYADLGPNWDGEDAEPIDLGCIERARTLLSCVSGRAGDEATPWLNPLVAPTPEGGVDLSWKRGARWTMLTLTPGSASVRCIARAGTAPADIRMQSEDDAIRAVLWALGK